MINAEVIPAPNNTFLVRFSNPNEDFGKTPYQTAYKLADIERQVYFKNRDYIVQTLIRWLNQREHAMRNEQRLLSLIATRNLLYDISGASFYHVMLFVRKKFSLIESFAPGEQSRFYNHYKTKILPVLQFCIEKEKDGK